MIFYIPNFVINNFNLHPGHPGVPDLEIIALHEVLDFVSFNFIKLSEFIELLLCFYLLNHSNYFAETLINHNLNVKEKGSKSIHS